MIVYCARPMSGFKVYEIQKYYEELRLCLPDIKLNIPFTYAEKALEGSIQPSGYEDPYLTNTAIVSRDKWLIRDSDLFLGHFSLTENLSAGMIAELVYAHTIGLHTVSVIDRGNPHQHAFVLYESDVIVEEIAMAIKYIGMFK